MHKSQKPMKRFSITAILFLLLLAIVPGNLLGINTTDTRMLAQPAISANNIAFIYAQDLWIANTDGSQPRRLTVDEGIESDPQLEKAIEVALKKLAKNPLEEPVKPPYPVKVRK